MPFTPIRRGAFTLTERGLLVQGDAPYEQWVEVCALTAALAKYGFFLLGDCLNYGTATYGEKYREAEEFTGLTRKRLRQIAWVANKVDVSRRRDTLEFGMHQEVAALEPAGQAEALDWIEAQARSGKEPSRTDVRRYVQDLRRAPVVRNIGEIQGKFHVVSADPPWPYHDSGASAPGTSFQKAENHYATMSIEKIAAIPVKDHVLKNAVLFLWVTSPMLSACWPVIEAWGFEYKTGLVWDKVDHIVGHYVSVRHEHLLLCTRGSCTPAPQDLTPMIDSVQTIKRGRRRHSEKPEEFSQIIDRLYPRGPKLEMFGRRQVDGWTVWGNQIGESVENKRARRRSGHRGSPMLPSPSRRKGPSKIRAEDGDTVTADARATGFRDRIRGNDV